MTQNAANRDDDVPEYAVEELNLPVVIKVQDRETYVRERFWVKIRKVAGKLPFAEDIVAAYYCALDPKTPVRVKVILLGALAYFIMPVDALPDFITGLGFTDDATVLMTAIGLVGGNVKEIHRKRARATLFKPEQAETGSD